MIGTIISHYKILEKLGEGGMGVVYKAQDTKLKRTVALKFLPSHVTKNEQDLARFLQEAQSAAALNHPNVCTIYEIHDEGENPFIVMEYVEGETLRERKKEKGKRIKQIVDYAIQIAEALKAAHAKGVIHRDIKSDNIMITEDGRVKVMDFGLAKLRGAEKLTKSSSTLGTVAYMSPEHLQGQEVDARTDIFSFGVVLYEMLTGELPFKGEYESAMMYAIVNEDPEPVQQYRTDLSSELLHVLNRALEKDPEERYQSVKDMLIDLKRLKRDTNKVSRESLKEMPADESFKKKKRKKRPLWIGISAAMVLILIAVWFIAQQVFRKGTDKTLIRENSIAVMYFENRTGEEDFGKILVEMLTSNLSRCREIDVLSSQYLFDILRKMGMEDTDAIGPKVASDVAVNAGVKTMLLGSIFQIGSSLSVNAQLCDVNTGTVIGAAQAQGSRVEDVYQMVNKLTSEVIGMMGVVREEGSKPLSINDVTTQSFEAYKHYQKGIENIHRWEFSEGLQELRKAIQLDSTFAMAHCRLALYMGIFKVLDPFSNLSRERHLMRIASQYAYKTTDKERGYIKNTNALLNRDYDTFYSTAKMLVKRYPNDKELWYIWGMANHFFIGDYAEAVRSYNRALEIDPQAGFIYNVLAYSYSSMNEDDKAISAVRKYISLQPEVINTYHSAFEIYLMAGRYDDAYQVCEEALQVNPRRLDFRQMQSYIHLFRGEGEAARKMNREITGLWPSAKFNLINDLGCFNLYEGRYRAAGSEFQKAVRLAQEERNLEEEIKARMELGKFYCTSGDFQKAYVEFSAVKRISTEVYTGSYNTWPVRAYYWAGLTSIYKGDYQEALAYAERIKDYIEGNSYDIILMDFHFLLLAELAVKKKNLTKADSLLGKVSYLSREEFPGSIRLTAKIREHQKKYDEAVHLILDLYDNWILSNRYFFSYFLERSRVYYRVAALYEKQGNIKQAVLFYEKALEQWKDADADLPEMVDARVRLARLRDR